MYKTYLYLPEDLATQIKKTALVHNKTKAVILRQAIKHGLITIRSSVSPSAKALLKIAEIGEKVNAKGPKDLSSNLDKYAWQE